MSRLKSGRSRVLISPVGSWTISSAQAARQPGASISSRARCVMPAGVSFVPACTKHSHWAALCVASALSASTSVLGAMWIPTWG